MSWKDDFPIANRYFETDNGILYNANCLNVLLNNFPEKTIDLILTDPPYNIADKNKLTKKGMTIVSNANAWGESFKDSWDCMEDYYKWLSNIISSAKNALTDNGSLIMFLDRKYTGYFVFKLEQDFAFKFKNKMYFLKNNPVPHIRKNNYRSCMEEVIWLTKSKKYYINFVSQGEMKQVFIGNIGSKVTTHPTEKYEWMIKPLIIRHTQAENIILDPFAGSGTTLVTAEKLNRRWIGIELSEKYCEISAERLAVYNQPKLF